MKPVPTWLPIHLGELGFALSLMFASEFGVQSVPGFG